MKKRCTAWLLTLVMLITTIPSTALDVFALSLGEAEQTEQTEQTRQTEQTESVSVITLDGNITSHINLTKTQKTTVDVTSDAKFIMEYQWQILLDEVAQQWVNIYDKTQQQCEIGYALVATALDENNNAYLRCKLSTEKGEEYTSILGVTIIEENDPVQDIESETVVLEQVEPTAEPTAEPTVEPTTEPTVEPTTEPTAEPTVEPTAEPTVEPTAEPTAEPTTEPTVEPTAEPTAEPTVEPTTEPTVETTAEPTVEPTAEPVVEETTTQQTETQPAAQALMETSAVKLPAVKKTTMADTAEQPAEAAQPEIPALEDVLPAEEIMALEAETPVVTEPAEETPAAPAQPETPQQETVVEETTVTETVAQPAANEEESVEYVTITINYLDFKDFEDGKSEAGIIYSPFIATLEKGEHGASFSQNVPSPTYVGFKPFYDADGAVGTTKPADVVDEALTVPVNVTGLKENLTINVYYKPVKVSYSMRFFYQNINDDFYTEDVGKYVQGEAYTGTIFTKEEVDAIGSIGKPGFQMLYHIPEEVAADGSTQFECYYDRLYYLLQFDLDGGYGVEPIYGRYQTPFAVKEPIKHGYVFEGWYELTEDTDHDGIMDTGDPSTAQMDIKNLLGGIAEIPSANKHYKAKWGTADTFYTVVYWKENIDDNKYSYWGYKQIDAVSGTFKSGEDDIPDSVATNSDGENEKSYFTFNKLLSDKNVLVEGDGSSVVNVYYNRNYYTFTFRAAELCTIPEGHVHTAACYDYICGFGDHEHTAECNGQLICTKTEHIHDGSCVLTCGKTEHGPTEHVATCCGKEEHEHTVACWGEDVGNKADPSYAPSNPKQGQVYVIPFIGIRYIYLNGSWYNYNGTASNETIIKPSCGKDEHEHGDGTCVYLCHQHSNSCYGNCEEHTHTDECYKYDCDQVPHTHTADCERLKCSITANHTHNSTCTNASRTNVIKTVRRKYGASLADIWPVTSDNGKVYNDGQRWDPDDNSDTLSQVIVYLDSMPGEDITFTVSTSSNSLRTLTYYKEVLPGEPYDITRNGHNFKLYKTISARYGFITKKEDWFDIIGFDKFETDPAFRGTQSNATEMDFYYTRSRYDMEFNNNGTIIDEKTQTNLMYGAPLASYYFEPDYPNLEPNAYEFGGWYTTKECYPGTEVDWETITMPDGPLLLYANWVPLVHRVRFFKTFENMNTYLSAVGTPDESLVLESKNDIVHGTAYGSIEEPERVEAGNAYQFAGWFYIENGEKKAFSPLSFPVRKDLDVFADWGSVKSEPFYIKYVLKSDPTKRIADDTMGYAFSGTTRTFNAKSGAPYNQLYNETADGGENYNQNYFPIVASHSVTMKHEEVEINKPEDWKNLKANIFTFEYVRAEKVKYTVQYVDKETGTKLRPDEIYVTSDAVVTQRFKFENGMLPDAFYKRLVLGVTCDADGNVITEPTVTDFNGQVHTNVAGSKNNVITFYYTPNTKSAYYAVHFMMEKLDEDKPADCADIYAIDGSGHYEESTSHMEGIGDKGQPITITPQSFVGFELVTTAGVAREIDWTSDTAYVRDNTMKYEDDKYTITVNENGTELYIYYNRQSFGYSVYYKDYNTRTDIAEPIEVPNDGAGVKKFGSTVECKAVSVPGYKLVTDPDTYYMNIKNKIEVNTYTFYYIPIEYNVEYIVVTDGKQENGGKPTDADYVPGGYTAPSKDTFGYDPANLYAETSKATAFANYKFDGWYTSCEYDEGTGKWVCSNPATAEYGILEKSDASLPVADKFTPLVSKLNENMPTRFYAKFSIQAGPLTIDRTYAADENQVFVYEVENADGDIITVTVVGDGEVTITNLPYGKYTIRQINDWSWRYTDAAKISFDFTKENNKAEFSGTVTGDKVYWLSGHDREKNIYNK